MLLPFLPFFKLFLDNNIGSALTIIIMPMARKSISGSRLYWNNKPPSPMRNINIEAITMTLAQRFCA
jgi:hypothetical protein